VFARLERIGFGERMDMWKCTVMTMIVRSNMS